MDGRRKLTVLTDTAWGFGAGPDVPVKREWDRCGAAKLGLQPPFRAGTCGTGGVERARFSRVRLVKGTESPARNSRMGRRHLCFDDGNLGAEATPRFSGGTR